MTRSDRLALLLSLAAVLVARLVAFVVYEDVPHLEDEVAYAWQARVMASGRLALPSPEYSTSFLVPFVVDYQGLRFGKYPPGWPAVLAIGEALNLRGWVNPLLAGLSLWLIYRLGKRLFSPGVGLLAGGLLLTSPFWLMNSGSLLSHPLGLLLSAAFSLAWLGAFQTPESEPSSPLPESRAGCDVPIARVRASAPNSLPISAHRRNLAAAAAALCVGLLALTRPLTAAAICLPYLPWGLALLWRGSAVERRRLLLFGLLAAASSALLFAWQFAVTGDPLLNPYTLWWEYDRIGFGPGHGHTPDGHSLQKAWRATRFSLSAGWFDLWGWGGYSWLLLPFGLLAAWRKRAAWPMLGVPLSLVLGYAAYWVGSWLFGPRYYYEGLPALALLTAAGAVWLGGWAHAEAAHSGPALWLRLRRLGMTALLAGLVGFNLIFYAPLRLGAMHNLFSISRSDLETFLLPQTQELAPALIIVQSERWMGYAALLELEAPDLSSPFIFAWDINAERNAQVAAAFPERTVYRYDPNEPGKLWLFKAP